jgi:hypothetical protein
VRVPGGKPVIEVPGETPTFPEIKVDPVFVTVVLPRTAKLCPEPTNCAAAGAAPQATPMNNSIANLSFMALPPIGSDGS